VHPQTRLGQSPHDSNRESTRRNQEQALTLKLASLGKSRRTIVALATFLWGLVVGLGPLGLEREKGRPGEAGDPSRRWPSASVLPRDPTRPNLLLTLHPHCPCSDDSLAEFARIMARCQGRVAGHVLFVKLFQDGAFRRAGAFASACKIERRGQRCR
jgi:hypothetical protein